LNCPKTKCKGFLTYQTNLADLGEKGFLHVRSEPNKDGEKHWVFIRFDWTVPHKVHTQFCSNALCDYNNKTYVRIFHEKKKVLPAGIPTTFF